MLPFLLLFCHVTRTVGARGVYVDLWAGQLSSCRPTHEQLGRDYLINLQVTPDVARVVLYFDLVAPAVGCMYYTLTQGLVCGQKNSS